MNAEGTSVALSTGLKFSSFRRWTTEFSARGYEGTEPLPPVIGDVNGDGLADIIGFTAKKVFVAQSQVSTFHAAQQWPFNWTILRNSLSVKFASNVKHSLRDINGDGRDDTLRVRGRYTSFLLSLELEFSSPQSSVSRPDR